MVTVKNHLNGGKMSEPKYKFGIEFYRLYDYWSFGIIYEQEQIVIGLIKWKLVIGKIDDWSNNED